MAYDRRFMLAADVFETILADSASEDEQSVESSSASDQSSAESSAGDEDVDNGQSSGRKRKVARCAEVNGGWADNTDFKLLLVENTVTKYHFGGTASPRGLLGECPLRLTARHFPSHIPPSDKMSQPTRKCKVCSNAKMRHKTRYMCLDCGSVPLCVDPCFHIYIYVMKSREKCQKMPAQHVSC